MTETQIQKNCLDWLKIMGFMSWRQNNGGRWMGDRYIPTAGRKGVADIIILHNKTSIWLEIKSETGRQSEDQIKFQQDVEKSGNVYLLVRSLKELQDRFKSMQLVR